MESSTDMKCDTSGFSTTVHAPGGNDHEKQYIATQAFNARKLNNVHLVMQYVADKWNDQVKSLQHYKEYNLTVDPAPQSAPQQPTTVQLQITRDNKKIHVVIKNASVALNRGQAVILMQYTLARLCQILGDHVIFAGKNPLPNLTQFDQQINKLITNLNEPDTFGINFADHDPTKFIRAINKFIEKFNADCKVEVKDDKVEVKDDKKTVLRIVYKSDQSDQSFEIDYCSVPCNLGEAVSLSLVFMVIDCIATTNVTRPSDNTQLDITTCLRNKVGLMNVYIQDLNLSESPITCDVDTKPEVKHENENGQGDPDPATDHTTDPDPATDPGTLNLNVSYTLQLGPVQTE